MLKLSFDNPDYAEPDASPYTDPVHRKKYMWFVSNVLNALDEILISVDDPEWRTTAKELLGYHKTWLATPDFRREEMKTYSTELRELIETTVPIATT